MYSVNLKLRANGRNIVDQQLPTLLDVTCCVRCTPCCMLFNVVAQSLKPVKRLAPCKRRLHCWPTTYNSQHCWESLRPFARSLMAYREEKCDVTKIHICEIMVFFFCLSSHTCANQLRHTKAIRGQVEFMVFNKKGKWRRRKNIFRKSKMKNPLVKNQSVSANWWEDASIALLWWLHSNPSKFGLDRNVNDLGQFQKVF